ncbi:MAG: hypothetical protein WC343_07025, partial [Bacilli bacterium]
FTVALSAVFGYIGPFWQILDSRASDGRLDDAHLSQDILPASAPQGDGDHCRGLQQQQYWPSRATVVLNISQ